MTFILSSASRSRTLSAATVLASALLLAPRHASAQSSDGQFQIGIHVATVASSEFDSTDVGVGGLLSWHPGGLVGAEAELTFYPSDFPDDPPVFTASRLEGLFGVTVGPRVGVFRPFVKLRPGFVRFAEAPAPFPCIAIFPPPLACQLAAGDTVFALDIGGGVEFETPGRTFLRVDAGDRAVRYPGPTIDGGGAVHDDSFFSHDFRFQIGGGVRF
jgi:hypothetical protein